MLGVRVGQKHASFLRRLQALGLHVSLGSMLACGIVSSALADPPFGSPAWIAQKQGSAPGSLAAGQSSGPGGAYAGTGQVTTPDQAAIFAQRSVADLAEAARRITAAHAAQTAAAQITAAGIPNGLAPGGLSVDPNVATNPSLWQFADAPTETVDNGQTTVTVHQTDAQAILTWNSFNVGAQTTLHFDQTGGLQADGTDTWIALNRVNDPTAAPSRIFGQIQAEGTVYIINHNGVLFGAGSRVDTHSLLVSSLSLFNCDVAGCAGADPIAASNDAFLGVGLTPTPPLGTPVLVYPYGAPGTGTQVAPAGNIAVGTTTNPIPLMPGDITVDAGATIHTGPTGYALLAAPNVSNNGFIAADDGQAILAAAIGLRLQVPLQPGTTTPLPGTPGTHLIPWSLYWLSGPETNNLVTQDLTPVMTVTNTGVLTAERGNITMLGSRVVQDGVALVSSSLTRPGTITLIASDSRPLIPTFDSNILFNAGLNATGQLPPNPVPGGHVSIPGNTPVREVILGEGSTTAVLPSANGETTISTASSTDHFSPGGVTILGDAVTLNPGALLEAPGADVTIGAIPMVTTDTSAVPGRIFIANDAIIDVSGLADVQVPMDATLITIPRVGLNELANSPVQRDGVLFRETNVVMDGSITGVRDDGTPWVGSPLLNAQGYVDTVVRDIPQLMIDGGNINLVGSQIVTAGNSSLRLDGGYIRYEGGAPLTPTRLMGTDGRYYSLDTADPLMTFAGIAGRYTVEHSRWNITSTYVNPIVSGSLSGQTPYIRGGNAGALTVIATDDILLTGDISGRALAGRSQIADGSLPSGGSLVVVALPTLTPSVDPRQPGDPVQLDVTLQDEPFDLEQIQSGFGAATPVDFMLPATLSDPVLTAAGLSHVSVTANHVDVRGTEGLAVQPGGSIQLVSQELGAVADAQGAPIDPRMTIAADLTAPGGTILLSAAGSGPLPADIVVSSTLSVRGRWVNDAGTSPDERGGPAFIDGGSITLTTPASSTNLSFTSTSAGGVVVSVETSPFDNTGSIVLMPSGVLDASSGGYVQPDGALAANNGVPLGRGGNITLSTYGGVGANSASPDILPAAAPGIGQIELDGAVLGYGFSGGGTLTINTLDLQIGGTGSGRNEAMYLQPEFFANQGFANYNLSAGWDVTIPDGVTVTLTHLNFVPTDAITSAPTGADLYDPGYTTISQLDPIHRSPTNLTITAGGFRATTLPGSDVWNATTFHPPTRGGDIAYGFLLGNDAEILADPGSALSVDALGQLTVLGQIVSHGGSITLSGDTPVGGTPVRFNDTVGQLWTPSKSVWLGPDAVLDVSGVALTAPSTVPAFVDHEWITPQTGIVLDGGTVTLRDNAGFVVAEPGARIDASGALGRLDLVHPDGTVDLAVPIASDAGSITLATSVGMYFDATVVAAAGSASAQGGTLSIQAPQIIVQQSGTFVPPGLAPGQDIAGSVVGFPPGSAASLVHLPSGVVSFAADLLQGSGVDNLQLVATGLRMANVLVGSTFVDNPTLVDNRDSTGKTLLQTGEQVPGFELLPSVLAFAGPVNLALPRSIQVMADTYEALPAGSITTAVPKGSTDGVTVTIDAPYVNLGGTTASLTPFGTGVLTVHASQAMDLSGQIGLAGFSVATFSSDGDLRVSSGQSPGLLFSPGDLNFNGARIYPASGATFLIVAGTGDASGATDASVPGAPAARTVTFGPCNPCVQTPDGTPDDPTDDIPLSAIVPLSAGGTLGVDAANIVQGGTLYAPSGSIVLGRSSLLINDPLFFIQLPGLLGGAPLQTASIRFAAGSTTSIFSGGQILPFGNTADFGNQWQYNGVQQAAPPAGRIEALAANVSLDPGANIDLRGGVSTDGLQFTRNGDQVTVTETGSGLQPGSLVFIGGTGDVNDALVKVTSVSGDSWTYQAPVTEVDLDSALGDGSLQYALSGASVTVQGTFGLKPGDLIHVVNATDAALNGYHKVTSSDGGTSWTFDVASAATASGALNETRSGDLQAVEWIPGLGGTRDVLAQFNVTQINGAPVSTPLFPDARPVFAVIPGYQGLVPTDPGTQGAQASLVGQSVYLSGVGSLPSGFYTLLPAAYATLPGAYRVVQDTSVMDSRPQSNSVLSDGSYSVAGYFTDTFDPALPAGTNGYDSRWTSFTVQSAPVWQQYSQYLFSTASAFFTNAASTSGAAAPVLPRDGGELVLVTTQTLGLGAQLQTAPGAGGTGARVDLASVNMQIGGTPLPGFQFLPVDLLNGLGASSLLIGGRRFRTPDGDFLDIAADSVVVANSADDPLVGPEILLASNACASGCGVVLQPGAVIEASGSLPASSAVPIIIGQDQVQVLNPNINNVPNFNHLRSSFTIGVPGIAGTGALLRLSEAGPVSVTRHCTNALECPFPFNATADNGVPFSFPGGQLTLSAGSQIIGQDGTLPVALELNSSQVLTDPTATYAALNIEASAASITLTNNPAASGQGMVIGPGAIAQFDQSSRVVLRSQTVMVFDPLDQFGNPAPLTVSVSGANGTLELSSPTIQIAGNSGAVNLEASGSIVFGNGAGNPSPPAAGVGTLSLDAPEIAFGDGAVVFSGFQAVNAVASLRIAGAATASGTFDFGSAQVTFDTPLVGALSATNTTVTTQGELALINSASSGASPFIEIGGTLNLAGERVDIGSTVAAPSGVIDVKASGDVVVEPTGTLDVQGVALSLFDVQGFQPGGAIRLTSSNGSVIANATGDPSSPVPTLNFAAAAEGGDAGRLVITAPNGTVDLTGAQIVADAPKGEGGSLSLDTGGSVDLDALAVVLATSGANGDIAIHTHSGNLNLSEGSQIAATSVRLIADGRGASGLPDADNGNVLVSGVIDASGAQGGRIELMGFSSVDLEGTLKAEATDPAKRGGKVVIVTGGICAADANGCLTDSTYGFETVTTETSGAITLGPNAVIDVTSAGATPDDASLGGTVAFRAPLLAGGSVNLTAAPTAQITGDRDRSLEAYAVWATTDPSTGNLHFTGIISAAGSPGFFGTTVAGATGTCETLAGNCSGTLLEFVRNLGVTNSAVDSLALQLRPGIELRSDGNILINGNWNLGAALLDAAPCTFTGAMATCTPGATGTVTDYAYRTRNGGQAPVVTLRAAGDVTLAANLEDGFVALGSGAPQLYDYAYAVSLYDTLMKDFPVFRPQNGNTLVPAPAVFAEGSDAGQVAQYYGMYVQYMQLMLYGCAPGGGCTGSMAAALVQSSQASGVPLTAAPALLLSDDPRAYPAYLSQQYTVLSRARSSAGQNLDVPVVPNAPPTVLPSSLAPVSPGYYVGIYTGAVLGGVSNTPADAPNARSQVLMGVPGSCPPGGCTSSSFRIVAGADLMAVSPLGLMPLGPDPDTQQGSIQSGSVVNFIRTGTGSIDLAAAVDVRPLTAYTAGIAADLAGHASHNDAGGWGQGEIWVPRATSTPSFEQFYGSGLSWGGGFVHPVDAGDLTVFAQRDVIGTRPVFDGDRVRCDCLPWLWLQTSNLRELPVLSLADERVVESSVDFAVIAGGVDFIGNPTRDVTNLLSAGGDVTVEAGRDIRNLDVALPTTWYLNADGKGWTVVGGGGELKVHAGRDIISGLYFQSRGEGSLFADGLIGANAGSSFQALKSAFTLQVFNQPLSTILAVQDAVLDVTARQGVDVARVYDPSYTPQDLYGSSDSQPYSARSAVHIVSLGGDVRFLTPPWAYDASILYGTPTTGAALGVGVLSAPGDILPATVSLTALNGDVNIGGGAELYPSAEGSLQILAGGSVRLLDQIPVSRFSLAPVSLLTLATALDTPGVLNVGGLNIYSANNQAGDGLRNGSEYFGMIDADPGTLLSPLLQPYVARQNAQLHQEGGTSSYTFTTTLPPPLARNNIYLEDGSNPLLHSLTPLHPFGGGTARIYAGDDITDGLTPSGFSIASILKLSLNMPAEIRAGHDIVNLYFNGQHAYAGDVTLLSAGHDIRDDVASLIQGSPEPICTTHPFCAAYRVHGNPFNASVVPFDWSAVPQLRLAGPGTLIVEAGHDLGPFIGSEEVLNARLAVQTAAERQIFFGIVNPGKGTGTTVFPALDAAGNPTFRPIRHGLTPLTGVVTVGNEYNPYLSADGADAVLRFGVGPGIAFGEFENAYLNPLNPAVAASGFASLVPEMIDFVRGFGDDDVTAANVWEKFQDLPELNRELFDTKAFFKILQIVADDYNRPSSPEYRKYTRGYAAINTLFPSVWGYTRNDLSGGFNGAALTALAHTGDLDLRGTTAQTQRGGDITLLGPGGQALIGGTAAPAAGAVDDSGRNFVGPDGQGILTLERGSIDVFLDRSLLLGQSRLFTEQGGDVLIWSSNGDVNAGRGSRTSAEIPGPVFECDNDHYCTEDVRGKVTGAGIATLQTIPGAPPGNVYLVAPRGTVDAGEGGLRVSGNLVVAAFAVANADNVQVQGTITGVPSSKVDVGALAAGNAVAAAAQQQAAALARQGPPPGRAETLITVDVIGLGDDDQRRKRRSDDESAPSR